MRIKTETIARLINGVKIEKESLPLRVWHEQRGLPIEIRTENYETTTKSHGKIVSIKRVGIWGKMESIEEFENRKQKNYQSNLWHKGGKISATRTFKWKEENGFVWVKLISKWNCGTVLNRKMIFDGKYLRLTMFPNETGIWYISGEGQIRFWILPNEIEVNDELLEVAGILDGELHKKQTKKGGMSVKVTNSEPMILKKVMNIFEKYFRISKEKWRVSLTINAKNLKQKYSKEEDESLKIFWSQSTGIPFENFGKTTLLFRYRSKRLPCGILQIRVSNFLFWKFLIRFLEYLRNFMNVEEFVVPYLRGLVAAEGGVGIDENGGISHLLIGSTKEKDKKFYRKCLEKLGIKSKEYDQRIEICGGKNFKKFLELDLFRLHPQRKLKFLSALNRMKRVRKKFDLYYKLIVNLSQLQEELVQ